MKNKVDRLQAIKEIIISHKISSQEDLLKQLTERGFDLTQATLSRDLKQLQIAKVAGKDLDQRFAPLVAVMSADNRLNPHGARCTEKHHFGEDQFDILAVK